jgi:tRNA A-37 threonylcarbamoyl transferase component Bud32
MGDVFVGENAIGLKVAIKVLKPELLANREFRVRFQKEAESIAAIQHPNVVRFLDLVVGDPTFLVLEYVEGSTLAQLLGKEKQLAAPRAVALALQLANGMRAAHRAGVIHRDVKPSNILVGHDEEHGEVPKLIDFGLAKMAMVPEEEKLTRTGQIVGTPAYMAPEQIAGRDVDERADIYSLGCLLYHLLAGRPPFLSQTTDDMDVLYRQVHDMPEPASRHAPQIPPLLDEVVMRMLAKDPEHRYGTMAAVAAVLQRSIEKRAPHETAPPAKRVFLYGMTAGLAAALALGAGWWAGMRAHRGGGDGTLLVDSSPRGAAVLVDGKPWPETTPTAIAGLAAGKHQVVVRRDDKTSADQSVELKPGERQALMITLPVGQRFVDVASLPAGGSIFVDGKLRSLSPSRIELVADDFHELKLEKEGYQTVVLNLKPDDTVTSWAPSLEQETQPRGSITVEADRPAEVWIDGAFTGFRAPTLALQVSEGAHKLELRDGGRVVTARDVTIAKGQAMHLILSERP